MSVNVLEAELHCHGDKREKESIRYYILTFAVYNMEDKCDHEEIGSIHEPTLHATFGILNLSIGILSIWSNGQVLKEIGVVRLSQLVNTLVLYTCWCCIIFGCSQIGVGFR